MTSSAGTAAVCAGNMEVEAFNNLSSQSSQLLKACKCTILPYALRKTAYIEYGGVLSDGLYALVFALPPYPACRTCTPVCIQVCFTDHLMHQEAAAMPV